MLPQLLDDRFVCQERDVFDVIEGRWGGVSVVGFLPGWGLSGYDAWTDEKETNSIIKYP